MAEVFHRYIGKGQKPPPPPKISPEEQKERADRRKADAELTAERSRGLRTKRMQSELILAKARNDLVSKAVVQNQASFLLVALRQKIMQLPATYSRRIVGIADVEQARKILTVAAHQLLADLQDLPAKVTDPEFLRKLDEEQTAGPKV
jgi:hypothetical protein